MDHALVAVDEDAVCRGEQIFMRDGIRIDPAEAEYQIYMDQLYSACEKPGKVPEDIHSRSIMMHHPWHNVSIGNQVPEVVTAVMEIPAFSRVKTELDVETGLLRVDRILSSSVIYPANFGFVPETLTQSGQALDIMVLCQLSVPPLSLMKARPIGVVCLIHEGKPDDKIIAVAVSDPEYNIYHDVSELPPFKLLMINQFFHDYRAMEKLDVKTLKPSGKDEAMRLICEARTAYHAFYDTRT
jgi:inorganic pyrophosphatase